MILSILVIAVALGLGYVWLSRGLFSAMLNLICVVMAGAIAFALWEPLSLMLVGAAPRTGFFGFVGTGAYTVGLLLPFAVSLALLRVASDSIVGANTKVPSIVDMVGGGVCGAVSGVIVMGFVVIGASYARLPTSVFGYEPIEVDRGSLIDRQSLLLPADELVATLYTHLSAGPMRSGAQLGYWYPELTTAGWRLRINHGKGAAVNVLSNDDFTVAGRYTVAEESPANPTQLFGPDDWYSSPQNVVDLAGNPLVGPHYIEGFKIDFASSAKESFGQVVVAAGQVWLLVEREDGTTYEVHPVAVVTLRDAGENEYARFRYMSRDAISSKGAGDASMAFEFPVEAGAKPVALFVKNARVNVADIPVENSFPNPPLRNAAIRTGSLMGGSNALANLDMTDVMPVDSAANVGGGRVAVAMGREIPGRRVMQEGQEGGLKVNDQNQIFGGTTTLALNAFNRSGAITKELRVADFAVPDGVNLVQVDVSAESVTSIANEVDAIAKMDAEARRNKPPVLIDTRGATYSAIGYVYEGPETIVIRYEPGDPIASLDELRRAGIEVSRNNPSEKLVLLFQVTEGVDVQMMAMGDKVVVEFEPPFEVLETRR